MLNSPDSPPECDIYSPSNPVDTHPLASPCSTVVEYDSTVLSGLLTLSSEADPSETLEAAFCSSVLWITLRETPQLPFISVCGIDEVGVVG